MRLLLLFMALAASSRAASSFASISSGAETNVRDDAPLTVATLRSLLLESEARSQASLNESEARINARLDVTNKRLDVTNERLDGLVEGVLDLAKSVLTPAVAENVELCARSMVLAAIVSVAGLIVNQCSAVPLPTPLASRLLGANERSSTLFFTSAHCFVNASDPAHPYFVGFAAAVQVVGSDACALLAQHLYTNTTAGAVPERAAGGFDLAVFRCTTPAPPPPPALSSRPYVSSTRVLLAGFSRGAHLDDSLTLRATDGKGDISVALHTKHTRLSSSLQTPMVKSSEAASALHALGFTEDSLAPFAFTPVAEGAMKAGYVEVSPWEGMSGGAVIDMSCGLVGITESRAMSAPGGQFVRLLPAVLQLVEGAVSAALAAKGRPLR